MAKYEIMLLASGKLPASEADSLVDQLKANIKSNNLDTKYLGIKELSYIINNEKTAHYYLLSFDGEANSFFDFHRLALINKSVLRHLIVNLDKDYGARALKNEKKVKIAKVKEAKYDEIIQNPDAVRGIQRKAKYERPKKRDEWELIKRFELGNVKENVPVKKPVEQTTKKVPVSTQVAHETKKPTIVNEPVKIVKPIEKKVDVAPVEHKPKVEDKKPIENKIDIKPVEHKPKVEDKKPEVKAHHPKDVEFVKTPVSEVSDLPKEKVEKIKIHTEHKSIEEVEKKIINKKATEKKPVAKKTDTKKTTTKKLPAKKPADKKTDTKKAVSKKTASSKKVSKK